MSTIQDRLSRLAFTVRGVGLPVVVLLTQIAAGRAAEGAGKPWLHQETRMRLFSPAWRLIGEQTPQETARKFSVIYGHLAPQQFHQGNPDCKVIKYLLGPYTTKGEMAKLPAEAMAHDAQGNVIKAREFPNWLVAPDSPKWIDYVVNFARNNFDKGFDGIFTDSMGTAPVETSYLLAKPVNPATGKLYTKVEWLAAEAKMAEAIRKAMPPNMVLTLNGLGQGSRYWTEPIEASPRILLKFYDGAMSEQIWRQPTRKLTDWPTFKEWMSEIRMIQDVERRGLMGFWWTKCWTDGNTSNHEPDADKLVPQWRRFALASYLLAAGPNSYFNFDTVKNDKPKSNAAEYFIEYDAGAVLGAANAEMQPAGPGGSYFRAFANGFAVVNPTEKAGEAVIPSGTAGKPYKSWGEGRSVRFPVTVDTHTGLILTAEP
jgi:hypothetical protein